MQKPAPVYSAELVLHPERDTRHVHFEQAGKHPFQPAGSGISRVNAWWLAESALLTYWDPQIAIPIFERAGFESTFIRSTSTDVYLAWQDQFVIVAFRGTEPDRWEDVLTDAQLKLVAWPQGKVHRGFKRALDEVWPTLQAELSTLSAGRSVWFCGHSLGAALATLAAVRYPQTRGVCTFGCPRVGDARFASAFGAALARKSLRYVNHHDIVTHVPTPLWGYKHVDASRIIAPDGTISTRRLSLDHFFDELIGPPGYLLETFNALNAGTLTVAPNALVEHMPKAYAIWTWNDYEQDAAGRSRTARSAVTSGSVAARTRKPAARQRHK